MKPVVLVTGASGFIGRYAAEALKKRGWDVLATNRSHADLNDPAEARVLVAKAKPQSIVHAAGLTRAPGPLAFWDGNVSMTLNLAEAALSLPRPPRLIVIGSAAEYGEPPNGGAAVHEDTPCRPLTPYGCSKLAQTLAALSLRHRGLDVVVGRLFNSSGPGGPGHIVPGTFARQLAQGATTLMTGGLDSQRDFTDVRDIARALALLAEPRALGGLYNICSGRATTIRSVVETLISLTRRSVVVRKDKSRGNPAVPRLVGDPRKLRAATGWKPEIALEDSLRDTLESAT
jgi:nucleoside-diphosphate-sugar epimerase